MAQSGNDENTEILCVVLETGIDSLVLKSSQFPLQYLTSHVHSLIIQKILLICSLAYILIACIGILTGYIHLTSSTITRGTYLTDYQNNWYTNIGHITLHHFTNYIMFIPILLRVMYLLYIAIQTKILENRTGIIVKDKECITGIDTASILVTTLVADLPRSDRQ